MRIRYWYYIAATLLLSVPQQILFSQSDDLKNDDALSTGRALVAQFLQSYRTVLLKAMSSQGTTGAISVCADTAQAIAYRMGVRQSVTIKRVSRLWRNPVNTPDRFEDSVLTLFDMRLSKGELNDQSEYYTIVKTDSGFVARYLKPIVVQQVCLSCHGPEQSMSEDIRRTLKKRYPDDRALGYAVGDLRGAVSVVVPIR